MELISAEGKTNVKCETFMSLRASSQAGVAIRSIWSFFARKAPMDHLCAKGIYKASPCKGYGSPHHPAGWFAMTVVVVLHCDVIGISLKPDSQ